MTLEEIKQAVEDGHKVHSVHDGYEVIKDILGQWFIRCTRNGHCIGLTWADGVTMNGKPDDFYVVRFFNVQDGHGTTRAHQYARSAEEALAKYAVSVDVPSSNLAAAGWRAVQSN